MIRIYNSVKQFSERARTIIDYRYPNHKIIEFIVPKIKQPDKVSCGIFSIAYATALIIGDDPADIQFNLNKYKRNETKSLRNHLVQMLEDKKTLSFLSKSSVNSHIAANFTPKSIELVKRRFHSC